MKNLQTAYLTLCSADMYCMVFNQHEDSSKETDKVFTKARVGVYMEAVKQGIELDHNESDLRKWQRIRTLEQSIQNLGAPIQMGDSYDWTV